MSFLELKFLYSAILQQEPIVSVFLVDCYDFQINYLKNLVQPDDPNINFQVSL